MRIDVLGLGQSVLEYNPVGNLSIGVNDIFRYFSTDYLVCVDFPSRFNPERLSIIKNSTPRKFYSQIISNNSREGWDKMPNFEKIELISQIDLTNSNKIPHSNNSPFIAAIIAYHLGADEIVLFGVDFVDHKSLSSADMLRRAKNDFQKLQLELQNRGVNLYVSSKYSRLSEILPVNESHI